MSSKRSAVPGTPDLLAALDRLRPMILADAQVFDRERRLTDRVFDGLAAAGLFKLWLPRSHGGSELAPAEFMEVVEAASMLDGSVGWVVGNGGGIARVAAYLPASVTRPWFADGQAFMVSTTGAAGSVRPVDGGYRVSGRWPFASGIHHATSVHVMGLHSTRDSEPRQMLFRLPPEQAAVIDTWHATGLRGSGSCDIVVDDAFVPEGHAHDLIAPTPSEANALYRLPNISAYSWTVATVPLGIARGAIADVTTEARTKVKSGGTAPMREREVVQDTVGRAEARLRSARAFLLTAMADLMATVERGDDTAIARGIYRCATANAAEAAVEIVESLSKLSGAGPLFETHPLERRLRDVIAAGRHIAMTPASYALLGRLSMGLDAGTPRF